MGIRGYQMIGGQVIGWAGFAPATGVVAAGAWVAVALTGASQAWTLTLDPDGPGGLAFTRADGLVAVRGYVRSASGATARVLIASINPAGSGSALVESIDPATGALANATGTIIVEVVLFGGVNL